MEYLLALALLFFAVLYVSISYLIYRVVSKKNPEVYGDIRGIKKLGIMFMMPVLVIIMAALHAAGKTEKK